MTTLNNPIFIGSTRSFWFGIVPAAMTAIDYISNSLSNEQTVLVFANVISSTVGTFWGWSPEQVHGVMLALSPLFTLIVAQQRAKALRPYTLDISKFK